MSESEDTQPPNKLSRAILEANSLIFLLLSDEISKLSTLWSPFHCPLPLLPWLAWSQGVKEWDENWHESVKRKVIDDSFEQHKYLGTRYAIIQSLSHFDMGAEITEWFEQTPRAPAGTFKVDVFISHRGIDLPLIRETRKLIDRAKRKSVDYQLQMNLQGNLALATRTVSCSATSTTVYPLPKQ